MTIQFNTNAESSLRLLPADAVFPVALSDEAIQEGMGSAVNEQLPAPKTTAGTVAELSNTAAPLIDWNGLRPDGTELAFQKLAHHLSTLLHAEIHFGRALASGGVAFEFSSPARTELADVVNLTRSAIVEASFAVGKVLVASQSEMTSGVLENFRNVHQLQFVISFAVADPRGPLEPTTGVVLGLAGAFPMGMDPPKLLEQLRIELSAWIFAWHACREHARTNSFGRLLRKWPLQRAKWLALGSAVASLSLLIPVPYWPQRQCVVEPAARRFVSSPVDGRVLRSLVRPGDIVDAGQSIGHMDDSQLRLELSAAQAELEQAGKQQDSALAHQEGGKMRMAQLEQQKVALKIQSLQAQLERLELRSPIAGVVLQGEWYRSEGAPVARGDTLFEIAPLETMTVQVHLTTEDLGEIAVDDSATVHVDSANGEKWSGKLSRIDPRAEVIDEQIRFVADMEVVNRDNRLRPGMKGTVRLSAGYRSLGWLVFHRPYMWLMKNLVW